MLSFDFGRGKQGETEISPCRETKAKTKALRNPAESFSLVLSFSLKERTGYTFGAMPKVTKKFFGYFLLIKQKKVTNREKETKIKKH